MLDWLKNLVAGGNSGKHSAGSEPVNSGSHATFSPQQIAQAETLITEYMNSKRSWTWGDLEKYKPSQDPAAEAIMTAPPELQTAIVVTAAAILLHKRQDTHVMTTEYYVPRDLLKKILQTLLRRPIPWSGDALATLLRLPLNQPPSLHSFPFVLVVGVCENAKREGQLEERHTQLLEQIVKGITGNRWSGADMRRVGERITALIEGRDEAGFQLDRSDTWAEKAESDLSAMDEPMRNAWHSILEHASTANSAQPTKAWLKKAKLLGAALPAGEFAGRLERWLPLVKATRDSDRMRNPSAPPPLVEENCGVLRGLVWTAAALEETKLAGVIGDLAIVAFRKLPNFGPLSRRVGNGCIVSLELLGDRSAVTQLSRLKRKINYSNARTILDKALTTVATRTGVTPAELEELSLPGFSFDSGGVMRTQIGDWEAESRIVQDTITTVWKNAAGRTQKSVPAEVKSSHAEAWKELKRSLADAESLLEAQKPRLERLLAVERNWLLADWRERYMDHPLVAPLARRLIWRFKREEQFLTAIWHEGHLVDASGTPIEELPEQSTVELWHPITAEVATIQAWREWLISREVTQPFKQAHREVYLLTDAEIATGTYSNRFAAHILRQHQFAALARHRGWRYQLQGAFDSHNTPTLDFPEWNLRVEFWVIPTSDDISDSGIHLYVTTGQVRFFRSGTNLPLIEIPARAFSEVMRDVDLFAGVASIASDPEWRDGGPEGRWSGYWHNVASGDLSTSAATRRDVLDKILPRLKIRDCSSLEDRFLIVRGTLHTYKIHLGSGNILMEPGGRYLCIVPDSKKPAGDRVFLPFEGDTLLSVILSKALLLADDSKITDPSIVRQIRAAN